ncbi:MAG: recombinase family protein [Planctomycetia bacterium]|nr:recombinase family protein [Planctomycetia bacterium]
MALVYSYWRFSSKQQATGDSKRRQVEEGQKWIDRNKHTLAPMLLEDLGVSAFKGKNVAIGALGRFLEAVRGGDIKPGSILLVEALDRLSRQSVGKAQGLFHEILEAGIEIVCLYPYEMRFNRDSQNDLVGLLIPLIAFHLAHIESVQKSKRVAEHWSEVRKDVSQGKFVGRKLPAWIQWTGSAFVLNEHAETLRGAITRVLDGSTVGRVLKWLNSERKPMGSKSHWSWTHLRRVLTGRTILGERQQYRRTETGREPVGEPALNYYPRLIEEETWYRLQHKLKKMKHNRKTGSGKFVNLFGGIVFNGFDGHSMVMTGSKTARKTKEAYRDRVLVSLGWHSRVKDACAIGANYHHVEEAFLRFVAELDPADFQSNDILAKELREKEESLAGLNEEIAELTTTGTAGGVGKVKEFIDMLSKLSARRDGLSVEVERLNEQVAAKDSVSEAQSISEMLATAQGEEAVRLRLRLRALIRDVVEKITIFPDSYQRRRQGIIEVVLRMPGTDCSYGGTYSRYLSYGEGLAGELACLADAHAENFAETINDFRWHLQRLREVADTKRAPVEDDELPTNLVGLLDCFFKELRAANRKDRHSLRSYGAKLISVVGDIKASALDARKWKAYSAALDKEVEAEVRSRSSAQTYRAGTKHFLRWLTAKGKIGSIDL